MNREVKINPLLSSNQNSQLDSATKKRNHPPKSVKKHPRRKSKSRFFWGAKTQSANKARNQKTKSVVKSPLKTEKDSSSSQLAARKLRQHQKQRPTNKTNIIPTPLAFICRLAIITVGISTIVGSVISIANSFNSNLPLKNPSLSSATQTITETKSSNLENLFSVIAVGQEIIPLKKQLQSLTQKYPQLEAGILIADIDNKSYVDIAGTDIFSSASTIKLPILVAFFQDVDAGKIKLDESLTITKQNIADGSGYMQYQPVGSKFTALKTATNMITVSDNTATNMLIERLGGAEALNKRFVDWGLTATKIRNPLPDLTGTNTTSPEDLSNLLFKIDQGEFLALHSRDRMLQIMKQTERNTLLPQGLGKGATIAHKTGDILSILGDTGIIDLPNGKRYIASILVKRPDNDPQAKSLIQEISHIAYQYFEQKQSQSTALPEKPRPFLAE